MEVRQVLLHKLSLPSTRSCDLFPGESEVGGTLAPLHTRMKQILELKGGRAGKVVKCQVASPS